MKVSQLRQLIREAVKSVLLKESFSQLGAFREFKRLIDNGKILDAARLYRSTTHLDDYAEQAEDYVKKKGPEVQREFDKVSKEWSLVWSRRKRDD